MSTATVDVVRTHVEVALNERNDLGWDVTVSPDLRLHVDDTTVDANGYRALIDAYLAAHPSVQLELINVVSFGENATATYVMHHLEPLAHPQPPHWQQVHFVVRDFTIVEVWVDAPPPWGWAPRR